MQDPLLILADDHALFRKGIIKAVSELRPNYKFLEAENGKVCLELCSGYDVDVVLLDIAMPEVDGHAVIDALKLRRSHSKIIVVSLYDEPSLILKLLSSGVQGYVPKNIEPDELVKAIDQVIEGKTYYPRQMTSSIENLKDSKNFSNFRISRRDVEIIKLMASGLTSKEIASRTGYTERTVETKKCRIEKKFKVKNSAQLIDLAYKVGILTIGRK